MFSLVRINGHRYTPSPSYQYVRVFEVLPEFHAHYYDGSVSLHFTRIRSVPEQVKLILELERM